MLVLSSRQGESIHVGDDVVVKVLGIHGSKVTIGINAPEGMRILRAEVRPLEAVEREAVRDADCCGV